MIWLQPLAYNFKVTGQPFYLQGIQANGPQLYIMRLNMHMPIKCLYTTFRPLHFLKINIQIISTLRVHALYIADSLDSEKHNDIMR